MADLKQTRQSTAKQAKTSNKVEWYRCELEKQKQQLLESQRLNDANKYELQGIRDELEKSRAVYRDLFDHAPLALLTLDTDNNTIAAANLTACALFGVNRTEMYQSNLNRFIEAAHRDAFHICSRSAMKEPYRQQCEVEMKSGNGPKFSGLLDIRGSPDSNLLRIAVTDISDRKKLETAKDEFISLVSHELRTPLTIISGSLRTAMSENMSPEDIKTLIENAIDGSQSMDGIIQNLLELSRAQAGKLKLDKRSVLVSDIINRAIDNVRVHHMDHSYAVQIPENNLAVEVDAVRLERIFCNLIDNAAKYSPQNSQVTVSASKNDSFWMFSIADEGPGIPKWRYRELFEPFSRLVSQSENPKGLGLGLVVCKRLVEAHGGNIWVESENGCGATFYFTVPFA